MDLEKVLPNLHLEIFLFLFLGFLFFGTIFQLLFYFFFNAGILDFLPFALLRPGLHIINSPA
jgi:hypothetical protein